MIDSTTPTSQDSTDGSCPGAADLPEKVRRLVEAIAACDRLTPTTTRLLLEASKITAEDLESWADFDHPKADSYGRKMIYDGGCFELMVMSWAPGDMASIHDHGYTQWGAVKMLGRAEHAIFKLEDGVMTTAERRIFEPGSVVGVGHDLIHQMGNPGSEPFLSLHLYGCYERDGDVTADANLYDLDEGKVQITTGGVFFSLPEDAIDRREEGPASDFPTRLRYKVELLRRLLKMEGTWSSGIFESPRAARVAAELFSPSTWGGLFEELERKRAMSPVRRERATDILHQELRAAAALQFELIDAGLADGSACGGTDRLVGLLAMEDLSEFGAAYVALVEESCSVAA